MPIDDTSLPARPHQPVPERALAQLADRFLPVAAIEFDHFHFLFRKVEVVEAADVYRI